MISAVLLDDWDHDPPNNAFGAARRLLDAWIDRPSDHQPAKSAIDRIYDEWAATVHDVERAFSSGGADLTADEVMWLRTRALAVSNPYDGAHAVAWGLDLVTWPTFTKSWRTELGEPDFVLLGDGDLYPVSDWLPDLFDGRELSVRPSAEHTSIDELPHLRQWKSATAAGSSPVRVQFWFDSSVEVRAAAEASIVGSIHPNVDLSEMNIPDGAAIWPIRPSNGDQPERVADLISAVGAAGAEFAVGGEVSLDEATLIEAQNRMDHDLLVPALVVVGSSHCLDGDEQANLAYALRARRGPLTQRKMSQFERATSTSAAPQKEGIVAGPRTIHIWTGNWARFAMVICKDLLDPGVRVALHRAGVNLLAVPLMSDTTTPYMAHVGTVSLETQGRAVAANNPLRHGGATAVWPAAIFAQPTDRDQVCAVGCLADPPRWGYATHQLCDSPEWHDGP